MTSVVGIDFGNLSCKIGVARRKGIDIIVNEVSNRQTPALVAFGPRNRSIGESAKTQETSNFKNTIGSLRRLIGRSLSDSDIQDYEKNFINADLVDVKGSVGVKVNYLGEETEFTATQLYAMMLGKLRDTVANETKAAVNDVVIAVPGWYAESQRRAVIDACDIAGLNPLKLVNENTATALGWGITRSDLPAPEEKPHYVALCDIGDSDYSVSIVAFSKGKLVIKGTAYDRHFGGRNLDFALVRHFAEEFKEKYKIDVLSNKKATFRLATAVEKLKKILSANSSAPLSVESIMNDIDASSSFNREAFEALIAPLLERTHVPLQQALEMAGLTAADIDSIELIGGSSRVPAIKQRISDFFGKPVSFTANQDEAIARGATFVCATLSPVFKVRDFEMVDIVNYPIELTWDPVEGTGEDNRVDIFDVGNSIPSTKSAKFYRKEPFDIEARYSRPESLPGSLNPWIARCTVKNVHPTLEGDHSQVRVKLRVNQHGIFSFESAQMMEEVPEKPQTIDTALPEGESPAANGEAPAVKKVRKIVKHECPMILGTHTLDGSILEDMRQKEGEMHSSDKLVYETEDRKNALEEYIYDMRDKLDTSLAAFVEPSVKETFKGKLSEAEDWLYSEEGEDATKSAYVAKLDELKKLGDPVTHKYREYDERPTAAKQLRETLQSFTQKVTSGDEKYSHLEESDVQSVIEKVANTEKWLNDQTARQAERSKHADLIITSAEIHKKREEVIYHCTPIVNKPKPKPKVSTPDPSKPATPDPNAPQQKGSDGAPEADMEGADETPELETDNGAPKEAAMDVD